MSNVFEGGPSKTPKILLLVKFRVLEFYEDRNFDLGLFGPAELMRRGWLKLL